MKTTPNQTANYINASIQLTAILSYQYLLVFWPMYIVMLLLGLVIFIQTVGAAAAFAGYSGSKQDEDKDKNQDLLLSFLVAVIYAVSCYQIYTAGYVFFATLSISHVVILATTIILRSIK